MSEGRPRPQLPGEGQGSDVVTQRVRCLVRDALRSDPDRWWDAEELADAVYARAPSISADPGAQVRRVLRAWRAAGEPGLAWDRQRRPSARARAMGDGRVGWQQVCRWTGEEA